MKNVAVSRREGRSTECGKGEKNVLNGWKEELITSVNGSRRKRLKKTVPCTYLL